MRTKTYLLLTLSILSALVTLAAYSPLLLSVPPVHGGEPAGDSIMRVSCVGLLPATANCQSTALSPFESLIYDSNSNNMYDAGEPVIVGPTPVPGTLLSTDARIKFRDTIPAVANNIWDPGELIFVDLTTSRVALIGTPSALATLVKIDPKIKFVDLNSNGLIDGVVRVTVRLENLGGTNIDATREEVDAIQSIFSYNTGVLQAMRTAYPAGGNILGSTYASVVRNHCTRSGQGIDPADPLGKALIGGGTPQDSVVIDDVAGKFQSSELCSQGPPRVPDVGLGCNPATAGSFLDGNGANIDLCPGTDVNVLITDSPLQNFDLISSQLIIVGRGAFTIVCVPDISGQPGCKIVDIDGSINTTLPLQSINAPFDNSISNPLTLTATCGNGTTGKPVNCSASATGGTAPYTFSWSAPGGTPATGTGPSFSTSYANKGTPTIAATVNDNAGGTQSKNNQVTIVGQALVVTVSCPTSGVTAGKPFNCTVSATGGTAPYTGTGTISRTEPTKGSKTETFTVTDTNNVSASGSATVNVAAQALVVTVSCPTSGVTAGKPFDCTVTATGGTAPYTGTGTISRTEPTKGTKTESFTVTDTNNVSASGSASVSVAAQALVVTVSCPTSGVTAGKPFNCTVTATGGTAPYTGTGTISRTEATKGTKTESFTVTDTNNVSASGSASVTVAAQALVVTVSCPTSGVTAGKPFNCTVTATGGTAPYTGTGTFSRTEATKGTKTESFTVTDTNNVSASGSASVSVAAQTLVVTVSCPTSGVTAGKPFNCTVTATGGTAPYTGTGTISRTEATKGTKTESFTVTDTNNVSASGSASVTVAAQALVVTVSCPPSGITAGKPFNCTVTATGGTAPYTGTGTFSRTEPTKGTKTESFTVTDTNNVSASSSASVSVAPQTLVVSVSCPTSGVTAGKPFNCTVTATGGTAPYTGTGTISRTEATKGTKTESFTVTDTNNVSASGSASVSVAPQSLVVTVSCPSPGKTAGKPFNCTVTATGGTAPYTGTGTFSRTEATKGTKTESFTVTDTNNVSASGSTTVTIAAQALVVTATCPTSGITAGKPFSCTVTATGGTAPYTGTGTISRTEATKGTKTESFTVTDANLASASGSASVTVAAQALVVTVSCPTSGVTAGKPFNCTVTATGGTAPYTGTGTFSRTEPTKGTKTESFTVTDTNNVSAAGSASVTVAAQALVVTVSCPPSGITAGKPFNCTVSATGGTAPYTGTGTISRTEATKGTKTETFTVTDANLVSASASASVSVAPQALVVTVSCPTSGVTAGKPFNCTVTATGGTAPYTGTGTFSRTEPTKGTKTESFTVTDTNNVSVSSSASVSVAPQVLVVSVTCPTSGVTAGKPFNCAVAATGGTAPYTGTGMISRTEATKGTKTESFTVTDANLASASGSASVSVAPQTLVVTVSCPTSGVTAGKPFNCTVTATGGTAPYTGTGTISRTEATKGTKTESFTVTDTNNVSASGSASVSVAAQTLVVTVSCPTSGVTAGKPFNCTVTATGGTAPYTGTGTISRTEATKGTKTESFTVTDTNNVSASGSASVNVAAQALVVTVSCPASGVTAGKPFNCTVSATGGTAPYTGTGTFSRTEATKGTKTESFTVTDTNNVSASGSATVNVAAQALVVTVSCPTSGVTAGKPFNCTVTATGGTAPYTGTGTFSRTEATKGTKTESFTVTDTNNVSASGSASVSVAAQPLAADFTFSPASPLVGQTVTFTATASGGSAPYTFSWNFGDGSPAQTGNPVTHSYSTKGAKTVTLTVTDANTATQPATHPVPVSGNPLVVNVSCPTSGITAGKPFNCTVTATGGTAPYTGTGTFSRTEATKGTKTESFTVTDTNTASASGSATVNVAGQALVVTATCPTSGVTVGKPFSCTVSATGGTAPYTGTGTISRTEATKGTKTESFTVTDTNNVSASGSASVNVGEQPIAADFTFSPASPSVGQTVTFTATATGGTAPYTFSWNFGDGSPAQTGNPVTHSYSTKGAKTVTLTVTDANTATQTAAHSVQVQGNPIVVNVSCPTSGVTAGKPFNCTVSATGGTPPFTGTGTFSRTEATKGTKTETFSVTDANGATASGSATVNVAAQALVVTVSCPTSGVTSGKPFNCTVTATGGTAPYTGTGTISRTEPTKGTKTESFTVTDTNNVSASGSATVNVAAQGLFVSVACPTSGITAGKPFNCTVSATGGTAPYTGTGMISRTEATKGTKTESFTVTDANLASASGSASVTVAAQALVVTVSCPTSGVTAGKPFNCTVSATGGTAPYTGTGTFSRTEPTKGTKTETFTVTDANVVSASGSAIVTVAPQTPAVTVTCPTSGVTAGKPFNCTVSFTGGTPPYTGTGTFSRTEATKGTKTETFTVTDANMVSASGSASVTVAPQVLVVTGQCPKAQAGQPVTCTASATGGSGPYTFSWSAPGGNPASGSGSSFTTTYGTKGSKTITITATDSNNVSASTTVTVVVNTTPFVINAACPKATVGQPVSCSATGTGGTLPYGFSWSALGGTPSSGTGSSFTTTYGTKGQKTITVTATDANGASDSKDVVVTVNGSPLVINASCHPTSTAGKPFDCSASASGGTAPYTFTWDVGKDGTIDATGPAVTLVFPNKGSFTIDAIVTDANGATARVNLPINITGQPLVSDFIFDPASPTAGKPVTFTATASGGTTPYTFDWNFGDGQTGNGPIVTHSYSIKGSYAVQLKVTDANNVMVTVTHTVTVTAQPFTVGIGVSGSPKTGRTVTFTAIVSGGTPPYVISWDFGDGTTGSGSPVSHSYALPGNYVVTLTVTEMNGGSQTATQTVTISPPLAAIDFTPTKTLVGTTVFVASVTGGTPPITCNWTFGDGTPAQSGCTTSHTYVAAGSFTVTLTVRDGNNEQLVVSKTVTVDKNPTFSGGKLSWKHHLQSPGPQMFTGKATNPSTQTALIRIDFTVDRPDGLQDMFTSPSFTLTAGQTRNDLTFNYSPAGGLGKYCFTGTLKYGLDMNADGILQDSELIGIDKAKSGCFNMT